MLIEVNCRMKIYVWLNDNVWFACYIARYVHLRLGGWTHINENFSSYDTWQRPLAVAPPDLFCHLMQCHYDSFDITRYSAILIKVGIDRFRKFKISFNRRWSSTCQSSRWYIIIAQAGLPPKLYFCIATASSMSRKKQYKPRKVVPVNGTSPITPPCSPT